MNYTPFLKQVANYYVNSSELDTTVFVFPNRRSSQQFEYYLKSAIDHPVILPRLMSMNDFVDHYTSNSGLVSASPIEALFILYQATCNVMGDNAGEFDKFAFWAQLIVNDFNDIDMNLVDAHDLYRNIDQYRNITTDYLTPEMKEAIRHIFDINVKDGEGKFWQQDAAPIPVESYGEVQRSYVTLWNSLADIYTEYGRLLQEHHLTTPGKLYRMACHNIENMGVQELGYTRIVFVGHDILSRSEEKIFNCLKKKDVAHFWWDNASPAFRDGGNPAAKLFKVVVDKFPSPEQVESIDTFPSVEVHDIPSAVGMAKCAFERVDRISPAIGIVLPNEALLEPLLNSLPDDLFASNTPSRCINITMSYQLKHSNIVSLMHLVSLAHKRARKEGETYRFYREDVRNILSHPIIKMAYTENAIALNADIEMRNEFNIPATRFDGTPLEPLFVTFLTSMDCLDDVKQFLMRLETFCENVFSRLEPVKEVVPDSSNQKEYLSLQGAFIRQYVSVLRQLRVAIDTIGLPVHDTTLFHLIDRMTSGAIIPFDGRSGVGIQVMGMLETRCLDFDDLRILSANDGTVPARRSLNSLIPNSFRAGFDLPTVELIDATDALRFYRLISRASKVTLFFDSSDASKAEPSRYVEQLAKVYGCDVTRYKRTAKINNVPELVIEVAKNGLGVKDKYTQGEPAIDELTHKVNVPCLSASSINKYIECPLQFYFHYVEGLNDDNDLSDFMDASTFGTIVHDTLQEFYYPYVPEGNKRNSQFKIDDINRFINDKGNGGLDSKLRRNVNKSYVKCKDDLDRPLSGQALILFETMQMYVKEALRQDIKAIEESKAGYLEIVECEKTHPIKLKLNGTEVNFQFKADRIDCIDGKLRLIDYKTGKDTTSATDVAALFTVSDDPNMHRPKAILQLLLYAMGLVQDKKYFKFPSGVTEITPMIYKLRYDNSNSSGAKIAKEQIALPIEGFDENLIVKEFTARMQVLIDDLLDDNSKFAQAKLGSQCCNYCHFLDFCRRKKKSSKF